MGVNDVSQLRPGDVIGGEFLIKQVFGGEGQSGMGVVYLVESKKAPFPFVLKSIQIGKDKDRFIKEALAWVEIGHHPNVVSALWVQEIDETLYIAAEYIAPNDEGRNTVQDYIPIVERSPSIIIRWACQFCDGMSHALSKGMRAHQDIKPENLMVDLNGNLKITDFGLAKSNQLHAQHLLVSTDAKSTGISGTPPYMAPEQFVDVTNVDHRADIYAFGVVLYGLTTRGKYPYTLPKKTNDPTSWAQVHLNENHLPIDGPFKKIIDHCLQKKPTKRYRSFSDLRKDLNKVGKKQKLDVPPAPSVHSTEYEELYMQAQSYVALGDKEKALDLISKYTDQLPCEYCGWTDKGRILLEMGRNEESVYASQRSIELYNGNSHPWNNLGIALNRLSRNIEAINAFENALLCDPENAGAMMNATQPLVEEGRYRDAINYLLKALDLSPTKLTLHFNAGNISAQISQKSDPRIVIPLLEKLTVVDSKNANNWHNLALVYQSIRQSERAVKCFESVLELEPDNGFALASLAKLSADLGKFELAIMYCDRLIDQKAELLKAITLKAQVLAHIGKHAEGISILQQVLQNNPLNDSLWFILAEIQFYQSNYEGAFSSLMRCKKILTSGNTPLNENNLRRVEQKLQLVSEKIKRN